MIKQINVSILFTRWLFTNLQEKLPSVTLFDLITRSDVEEILVAGPNSNTKKKQILSKARQRLKDQDLPNKDERVRPRENVFISDKSLADSDEALIGVFLGRYAWSQGVISVTDWSVVPCHLFSVVLKLHTFCV